MFDERSFDARSFDRRSWRMAMVDRGTKYVRTVRATARTGVDLASTRATTLRAASRRKANG